MKKGDKFQVISKYGNPIIFGKIKKIHRKMYKGDKYGYPTLFPYIESTNGVCYSKDQIKLINNDRRTNKSAKRDLP